VLVFKLFSAEQIALTNAASLKLNSGTIFKLVFGQYFGEYYTDSAWHRLW
jgi:hypothetical protein